MVVESEEVPVVDLGGHGEGEVEGEAERRVDSDAVESDSGDLDGGIGGVEEVDSGGEEEDCGGEAEALAETTSCPVAPRRRAVVGENDDVLWCGGGGVLGERSVENVVVFGSHVVLNI